MPYDFSTSVSYRYTLNNSLRELKACHLIIKMYKSTALKENGITEDILFYTNP